MQTDWTKHWNSQKGFLLRLAGWLGNHSYKKLMKGTKLSHPEILEFGSGSGINSLYLAKSMNAKRLVLVDFNTEALEICKENFEGTDFDVSYRQEDLLKFQSDEQFDIVHSDGLIEHFYDQDRIDAFQAHVDACKTGGLVLVFVPYVCFRYRLLRTTLSAVGLWIWDEKPFHREELRGLFDRFNLEILNEYSCLVGHELGIVGRKT